MCVAEMSKRLGNCGIAALAAAVCGCAADPEDPQAAGDGQRAGGRFQAALELIHRGELDSGAVALRQVLRADTAHYEARLGLGEILMRQRKFPEALHELERAAGLEPGRPEARMQQARVLVMLERRAGARELLAALVEDFPDRARPRMMLADLLMTRAPPDPQGALEQYEAVLRNNPGDSRARAGAAASRLRLGDFGRAAEEMSGLLAASPGKMHLAFLLGTAHHWLGEYEAAVAAYRQALDSIPKEGGRPQRMKWNLRVAWLALHGDYPGGLPAGYRLQVADLGEESPVAFRDVAAALGVAKRDRGRGNAWGDFDGDGDLDLFSTGIQVPHSLYRNESGTGFTDVTAAAGLGDPRGGWSATAVDYDNDGDLDLYATRDAWEGKAPNSLYRNLGDLRFAEVSEEAGVDDPDDSFTAAWADVDNDGRVDLYVAEGITGGGTPNKLFLNRGGRFEDGADQFGVAHPGKSIGAAFGDYDRDGDVDLYVADVAGPNTLYRNESGSGFTDITRTAGVAGPEEGGYVAFFADFDRDGAIDLFVSSMCYYEQFVESQVAGTSVGRNRAHLYRNLGGDRFADVAPQAGISRNFGTMGAGIGDVDYDGLVDLYLANGGPVMPRFEPNILYHNRGDRFSDVTESAGVGNLGKGHGATFADYDGDGDLDLYAAIGGHYPGDLWPNSLYRNDGRGSHWLAVELEGTRSNRSAVGAQVTVHSGGRKLIEEVASGGGFGTTNSLPLEFGLGAAQEVSRLEVSWPSGQTTGIDNPEVDGTIRIRED